MSGLRERLAAKRRRTATVPIQVTDPGSARSSYEDAERRVRLLEAMPVEDDVLAELEAAKTERSEAAETLKECFVEVEFSSAKPDDIEAILSQHTDAKGGWSITALPELAALCAVDDELQDATWWTEQLSSGEWASGERQGLWTRLISLNVQAPPEALPKD